MEENASKMISVRKNYIDNLRILCILLLFPFHTAMCFNSFGEMFYVNGTPSRVITLLVMGVYPWWMSLLFMLSGTSTVYAFKKRTWKGYLTERMQKILIPYIFGMLLVIPLQGYISDIFDTGNKISYFDHIIRFFTNYSELSGTTGCFTMGNLWFSFYLLIISIGSLPITYLYSKIRNIFNFGKLPLIVVILIGYVSLVCFTPLADVGGKSLGNFGTCFLFGYFIISNDTVLAKLKKYSSFMGIIWGILIAVRLWMFWSNKCFPDAAWYLEYKALELIGSLAAIGLSMRFLDFRNKFTEYFSAAIFPYYVLHQTILVTAAFFIVKYVTNIVAIQYMLIMISSFILTTALYELLRRNSVTRWMFGIKKPYIK